MRTQFIDWLLDQQVQEGSTGDLSRWIVKEMRETHFYPVDIDCLAHRLEKMGKPATPAVEALRQYASFLIGKEITSQEDLKEFNIISDLPYLEEKLKAAVVENDFERAAQLRDEINVLKNG